MAMTLVFPTPTSPHFVISFFLVKDFRNGVLGFILEVIFLLNCPPNILKFRHRTETD